MQTKRGCCFFFLDGNEWNGWKLNTAPLQSLRGREAKGWLSMKVKARADLALLWGTVNPVSHTGEDTAQRVRRYS